MSVLLKKLEIFNNTDFAVCFRFGTVDMDLCFEHEGKIDTKSQ